MVEIPNEKTLQKMGEYLRSVRESAGMSQAEAAKIAGFSGGYISVLEGGHREISKKTLFKLSMAYPHVSLGDMVEVIAAIKQGQPVPPVPMQRLEAVAVPASTASNGGSELSNRLEGALLYIEHDSTFQMPSLRPRTNDSKAFLVSMYQRQHPERQLMTEDELRRAAEGE